MSKQSLLQKFGRLSEAKKLLVFLLVFVVIGGSLMAYSSFAATNNCGKFHVDAWKPNITKNDSGKVTSIKGEGSAWCERDNKNKAAVRTCLEKQNDNGNWDKFNCKDSWEKNTSWSVGYVSQFTDKIECTSSDKDHKYRSWAEGHWYDKENDDWKQRGEKDAVGQSITVDKRICK